MCLQITAPISIDTGPKGLLIKHNRANILQWLGEEERVRERKRRKKLRVGWKGVREEATLLDYDGVGDTVDCRDDDEDDGDVPEDRR